MSMVADPGEGGFTPVVMDVGPEDLVPENVVPVPDWSATFVALYRTSYVAMVRLAYLLTGSNATAEEVVQEAFVRIRHAVDRVDNPGAYLRTSVVNGCHNQRRRSEVERRYQPVLAGVASPGDPDHLMDALATLPDRQRAVLVLRYYAGFNEAEIAELLGCRPGTVKSATSRGLAHLRKVIER
jgi:RNA polymerase sigma-70 factor (sigma-E family)